MIHLVARPDPGFRLVYSWLSNVLALFAAAWILPAVSYGHSWWTLLLAGLVFALANAVVKPLVILIALPAVVLTLGVALFFVNMLMLWLTDAIVPDFEVGGFSSIVAATLIVWAVNVILHRVLQPERRGHPGGGAPA